MMYLQSTDQTYLHIFLTVGHLSSNLLPEYAIVTLTFLNERIIILKILSILIIPQYIFEI